MFTPDITKIPQNSWVYLFKDRKDIILYIGKAKNLQKRIWQYFSPTSLRKQEMLSKAVKVDFLTVKNESEALYLEDNLIKQHQPLYNNLLKADNSYTYIKITKEQFPQIILTKRRSNDGSTYIGPKNDTIQLKKFLQYLRQILKFRDCKSTQFKQGKLCSDYYFWLCRWRCKLAKTKGLPDKGGNEGGFVSDYKNIITSIVSFFKWNIKPIEREIHEQIETAIIHENFERAAQLRDIYNSLQWFVEKQDVVLSEKKDGYLALVKSIGTQFIYTVLVFTQGKLMDVITSKEQQSDIEENSLHLAIQRTFWNGEVKKQKTKTYIISKQKRQKASLIKEVSADADGGFEWKPKKLKPLLQLAENFLESYIISQSMQEGTIIINDMVKILKDRYGLKKIPYRIECLDISHLSGGRTSGWLSCLVGWLPYAKWYRKYKIQGLGSMTKEQGEKNNLSHVPSSKSLSDDYAALEEVLQRRIQSWSELPDLLILDGGKGQLGIVKKLCKNPERKKIVSQIDIISLGKGEARNKSNIWKTKNSPDRGRNEERVGNQITEKIYTLDDNLKIHEIAITYDQADKILLKARDEAHRFANSYRKKQMSQERKQK